MKENVCGNAGSLFWRMGRFCVHCLWLNITVFGLVLGRVSVHEKTLQLLIGV